MAIALLTTYLTAYRSPLYERLHDRYGVEVVAYGGGGRYVAPWFRDLDAQLAAAPFPARRLEGGTLGALRTARSYEAVVAPFAGGAILPAAYAGARLSRTPFVLWASVWATPRSAAHLLALPVTRNIYRHANAVVAYGEHVKRFVCELRGRDDDVFVAPQSVEPEVFAREVTPAEIDEFRARHGLGQGPLILYVGRLVPEKGVDVLLKAFEAVREEATLVLIGDGPLAAQAVGRRRTRALGVLSRESLPAAYAAATATVLASVPTPRFREPWGLTCNESMYQGTPVIASASVGAVAGGLIRDGESGLVVTPGDAGALARAISQLLRDAPLRSRLGAAAREAVAPYTYDAMADAFGRALAKAMRRSPTGPPNRR
jgi:glycosyltransferase involved in cell wall biosynthesis